jgi:formylglycine-generating enzyme required for sulfatase activity
MITGTLMFKDEPAHEVLHTRTHIHTRLASAVDRIGFAADGEGPVREITVSRFAISRHAVPA